jgi:hypothetical protein
VPPDFSALPRVRRVASFDELAATPFRDGVNALCWERTLPGDFAEVAAALGSGEGIVTLDAARLQALELSPAGRTAVDVMLADFERLRDRQLDPALNLIHGYPRDEDDGPVPTHVFSFHADSAPVPADTWLCTYHGAPSEGLPNDAVRRCIDVPAIRAELLRRCGGADDEAFRDHLAENCYDLHYLPVAGALPFSFGVGNLWRIALDHPDAPVPPCIHRAPDTGPGAPPRLLLIS